MNDQLKIDYNVLPLSQLNNINKLKLYAEQGNVDAQYQLGYAYCYGKLGFKENDDEAFKWFKLSADQGHIDAQYKTGHMYHHGFGVQQDYLKAMEWYKLSAKQGYPNIQFYIKLLLKGIRKSDNKQLLLKALKEYDPDHYKLEIKSLEKQLCI